MAKAGWHKRADGTSGEVVGKQLCVPTVGCICFPLSVSFQQYLLCGLYRSGEEGSEVPLDDPSQMQQSGFRCAGSRGAFPLVVSLQVLVFSAHLGKTEYFYFQPRAIEERGICHMLVPP